jgi:cobalt-zinc-cadmium efflux system protein
MRFGKMSDQHTHTHKQDISDQNICIAFFLNVGFTIAEFVGGYLTNRMAIISDVFHDSGDCISLVFPYSLYAVRYPLYP